MNKKKLVIASVLKPVNDSRNYEKTAISINKSGNYQVHLVGQNVQQLPMGSQILFNPLFSFHRTSFKRFIASWTFLRYLFRKKPEVVIITTAELLVPAVIYKMFKSSTLLYDVQENYFRNLIYTNSFPNIVKHLLAVSVRAVEYSTRPFIDCYILAERNYEKEFSFSKGKSIVLENKLPEYAIVKRQRGVGEEINLLYTGTIARSYGVFEAVTLAQKLYLLDKKIRLTIAGFAAEKSVLDQLKETIQGHEYIRIIGGDKMVPHRDILSLVATCDIGLISYRPNKSTENCIPTKLYEYLAYRLPFVVNQNPIWIEITNQYEAGIGIDFLNPDPQKILTQMKTKKFYTREPGKEIFWEEEKLLTLIDRISAVQ